MTSAVIATDETFKTAWIESLKGQASLVALVGNEIREIEYQATDWIYPNIRVAVEFIPSINRCGPDDANITIECYSAEKSSKQSAHIASVVQQLYHGHPFTSMGIMFNTVIVRKVHKPVRSIFAWMTQVDIFCQGV